MKIYWTLKSLPELRGLPPDLRSYIWNRACAEPGLWPRSNGGNGVAAAFVAALVRAIATQVMIGWLGLVVGFACLCFLFWAGWVVHLNLTLRRIRPSLRRTVETEVGPRCEECGYDLRASPERCPECGTARGVGEGNGTRQTG